jgi:hypothetical protein
MPWAILVRSNNRLEGKREFLAGNGYFGRADDHPCRTKLFETRDGARSAIRAHFAHCARRDLRAEPHGWLAPIPVRVTVTVAIAPLTPPSQPGL